MSEPTAASVAEEVTKNNKNLIAIAWAALKAGMGLGGLALIGWYIFEEGLTWAVMVPVIMVLSVLACFGLVKDGGVTVSRELATRVVSKVMTTVREAKEQAAQEKPVEEPAT